MQHFPLCLLHYINAQLFSELSGPDCLETPSLSPDFKHIACLPHPPYNSCFFSVAVPLWPFKSHTGTLEFSRLYGLCDFWTPCTLFLSVTFYFHCICFGLKRWLLLARWEVAWPRILENAAFCILTLVLVHHCCITCSGSVLFPDVFMGSQKKLLTPI